jgi:Protein of unknown function (DUF3105)
MAKKRRKPRNRPQQRATTRTQAPGAAPKTGVEEPARPARTSTKSPTTERARSVRAERKEMARQERERARKAIARRNTIRRALTIAGVVTVLSVGAYLVFFNVRSPGDVSAQALQVAAAAGCGDIVTPAADAPGGVHLQQGQSAGYTENPATSGPHDPSPLPSDPAVHTEPIREENAVHNLEHGYVILYYRANGPQALDADVVDRLAQIAEAQDKVLLAPYPDLEEGTSFAITAWNTLWECPAGLTPGDAAVMANAFIEAYRGTSNAPEPNAA